MMRHCFAILICFTLSCLTLFVKSRTATAEDFSQVQRFLKQHCVSCHGAEQAEGELHLHQLSSPTHDNTSATTWARVIDVLQFGEMPPRGEEQPEPASVQNVVREISHELSASVTSRPRALRRLNRIEYENTVHDLLGIDVPLADLLPQDGSIQGFDNVADGLSISSVLMEQYLEAADVAFEATIRRIKPLPPETRRAVIMEIKDNLESVKAKKGGTIEVDNSFVKFTPGWPPARLDAAHPIEAGIYRCRVALWPHEAGERTISVALFVGSLFGTDIHKFIGNFDVTGTSQEPRIIEFTTHMDEGDTIHILPRIWPEHVTWRDTHEARPGVGIAWAETHGPLDQLFPSPSQRILFGENESLSFVEEYPVWMRHRKGVKNHIVESSQPKQDAERIIRNLIPKAFRRPVAEEEKQPFIRLTLERLEAGHTFEQAVRVGVSAVLCAPQFLLVNSSPVVDDYTIASRLSYCLWSTMPDEQLLSLAAQGKLSDPKVRYNEVERMLNDPRSEQFVTNFTGQWLDLRDIEFTTPDPKLYPEFDPLLQDAMVKETQLFFKHLLEEDLSVMHFVDSDFSFLNERIAQHYGIPDVKGNEEYRKVQLPEESIRGGVLTQASLLKVTANGTNTSPVIRGIWVLDNLFGRTSPPPPAGVPAVEPDIRGTTTIREQLDKHRDNASCASCHKRIDPPGFALEQFDPIGGERDWYRSLGEGEKLPHKLPYRKGLPVEANGEFANGKRFTDFREFRNQVLQQEARVAQGIAKKLLVYASGRPVTATDHDFLNKIVAQASQHNLGLRSMLHAVVESEAFLNP